MKISKQLVWTIGLGVLSFTLVGVGTASSPREAAAAAAPAPLCQPAVPAAPLGIVATRFQGVGTGGAAGSGPPLDGVTSEQKIHVASASPNASTTALVFMPLWARQ